MSIEDQKIQIQDAARYLLSQTGSMASIGIISGTGFDGLRDLLIIKNSFPVGSIPFFPSTGPTDRAILFGNAQGHPAVLLTKRLHVYEGFSMAQIAFVVRIMKEIGVKILVITCAAGGLNPVYSPGDILLITDHINLMGGSPLIGPNFDEYGPRFPDMTAPYDTGLIHLMESTAPCLGISLHKGVYAGVIGPNLETRAETRFLRSIGADAVGMSTVPEVIAAVHCGIRVVGVSVLSNINLPDSPKPHTLEDIVSVVKETSPVLLRLLKVFLERCPALPP